MACVFSISTEDVQRFATSRVGRKLTNMELKRVRDGLQAGLEMWEYIAEIAIDEVIGESTES
jgi:hypothetical protein